jgi:hypothetical protein
MLDFWGLCFYPLKASPTFQHQCFATIEESMKIPNYLMHPNKKKYFLINFNEKLKIMRSLTHPELFCRYHLQVCKI